MTTPSDPGVYISPGQMYQEVRALHDAMSRVEAKLGQILDAGQALSSAQHDHEMRLRDLEEHRLPEQVADHESRLRHLEERRLPHSVINIVAAAGATAALVWQAVGAK